MPIAKAPLPPQQSCELSAELAARISAAVAKVFGPNAIVRNYGTNPGALRIHVETELDDPLRSYDLLGILLTFLDQRPHVEVTVRGMKPRGDAKIAYRQGLLL
jgi:hypothetical protein